MGFSIAALPFTVRSLSMLPLLPASLVDVNNGESLFGEKEQARLLAAEQLPCMLRVLLDKLTLFSLFSSLVWHLARMCFVQVGRLERCCCCLHGLHCDSSDMNDALRMYIILLIQDVSLASASWLAVGNTFL